MDSTRWSFTHAKSSRGISARACAAKTMTWELESAKGVIVQDASIIEVSLPQSSVGGQENYQINENHKKMMEQERWASHSHIGSGIHSREWVGRRELINTNMTGALAESQSCISCFHNCWDDACDSQTINRTRMHKGGGLASQQYV